MADSLPTPADSPQVEPSTTATEDHLAQGIRYLALSKYAQAAESLSYAVEDLTKQNGELSIENVDALVLYGKALLANAIEQSAVLGGSAVPTAPAESNGAGPSASSSTNTSATAGPSNSAAFHFGGDGEESDEDEDEQEEGDQEQEGDEEKEDDFESAFVVLDMARRAIELEVERLDKVLTESEDKAMKEGHEKERVQRKEKLAEVHRVLGDVATESEHFEDAVEEYSSALSILTKLRLPSDRILSELHMLIALALEFRPEELGRAVSHAEKSKGVLIKRLGELENKDEAERTDRDKREIQDIKELVVDVDAKIEDLKTVPAAPEPSASDLTLQEIMRSTLGGVAAGSSPGPLPINNLNSLVKKKKKPSASASTSTPAAIEEPTAQGSEEVEGQDKGKRKATDTSQDAQDGKKAKLSEQ